MEEFKLHKYPYHYKCNKCSHEFKLTKEKENYWKDGYGLFEEDPLFFECEKCRDGTAKPIGYTEEGNFYVPLPPTKEEIAEWDEMFGPLEE